MKVGTAGWGYLHPSLREELGIKGKDRLLAYGKLFPMVEINSTFYKLPKVSTVERWRKKVDGINKNFEFTVKAYKGITHDEKFKGKSQEYFERVKEIAHALRAKVILFQTPSSFKPTKENIERAKNFFLSIDRENFTLAWEVRWVKEWRREIVKPLFEELDIIHVVDPLRQRSYANPLYYRLHGFGKPMYNYTFSEAELKKICDVVGEQTNGKAYVVFNNYDMYRDALRFMEKCPSYT